MLGPPQVEPGLTVRYEVEKGVRATSTRHWQTLCEIQKLFNITNITNKLQIFKYCNTILQESELYQDVHLQTLTNVPSSFRHEYVALGHMQDRIWIHTRVFRNSTPIHTHSRIIWAFNQRILLLSCFQTLSVHSVQVQACKMSVKALNTRKLSEGPSVKASSWKYLQIFSEVTKYSNIEN